MVSHVTTATVVGLEAEVVEVEADITNGLPATVIVGLPDMAVQESKERVKSALKNSDCKYPQTRVSINLAPADTQKIGTHFDVPIALAIVLAAGDADFSVDGKWFLGELSLDGVVRPVPGVLAIALKAQELAVGELYVPASNAKEAALVRGIKVYPVHTFRELIGHLLGVALIQMQEETDLVALRVEEKLGLDMKDVSGQETAKRALEVAASGGHNVLMSGPPGSGKTLLARALSGLLPAMELSETLELTKIYSIAGQLPGSGVVVERPVRSPHHTTSSVALVGGGSSPKPGEITLSHRGVLFMDELPEFPRNVLEALRQPLEDGVVTVSRAKNTFTFPAKFILVAALNPCACGYFGDNTKRCVCTPSQVFKYQKRLSGPLLDRIDLHIDVPRLSYEKMSEDPKAESSAEVRGRVERARGIQRARLGGARTNSEMNVVEIRKFCKLGSTESEILAFATTKYNLSGRSIHRLLKIARTIADLAGLENISKDNLAEALQYRPKTD